jgi:hypothetical protein
MVIMLEFIKEINKFKGLALQSIRVVMRDE